MSGIEVYIVTSPEQYALAVGEAAVPHTVRAMSKKYPAELLGFRPARRFGLTASSDPTSSTVGGPALPPERCTGDAVNRDRGAETPHSSERNAF